MGVLGLLGVSFVVLKLIGYQVLKGAKLKEFKELFAHLIAPNDDDEAQSITDDTLSKQTTEIQSVKRDRK